MVQAAGIMLSHQHFSCASRNSCPRRLRGVNPTRCCCSNRVAVSAILRQFCRIVTRTVSVVGAFRAAVGLVWCEPQCTEQPLLLLFLLRQIITAGRRG